MRKIFDSKAGATFHEAFPKITFCVKKECLELIYKLQPGIFMIVNMIRTKDDEIMLFTNWGTYFNRIQNPQAQLQKIEKCCKTLYSVLTDQDKDGVLEISLSKTKDTKTYGFSICMKTKPRAPLITCIDDNLLTTYTKFVNKNITIFNELSETPPFPAWKDGLEELWN